MASRPVVPQNDNVAHALAGAGGGVLSMVLTYVLSNTTPFYFTTATTTTNLQPLSNPLQRLIHP